MIRPFNYIHLSSDEMVRGYFAYYCMSKISDLRLQNIKGYFVMADDTTFNFWNKIELAVAFHPSFDKNAKDGGVWWSVDVGSKAAKEVVNLFEKKYKNDTQVQAASARFGDGWRKIMGTDYNTSAALTLEDSWSVSDLYYVPSSVLDYHAVLMEIFFEGRLFHEIAIKKFFSTVQSNRADPSRFDYLYGPGGRGAWHRNYNAKLFMMHPIKFSYLGDRNTRRIYHGSYYPVHDDRKAKQRYCGPDNECKSIHFQ